MPGFRAISQMFTGAVPAYYDAFKEDKQERETGIYSPTSKILWTSRAKKIGRNISLGLTYEMTAPWAWEIHILLLLLYLVLILNLKHLLLTRTQCVVAFWLVVYGPLCCVISSPLGFPSSPASAVPQISHYKKNPASAPRCFSPPCDFHMRCRAMQTPQLRSCVLQEELQSWECARLTNGKGWGCIQQKTFLHCFLGGLWPDLTMQSIVFQWSRGIWF